MFFFNTIVCFAFNVFIYKKITKTGGQKSTIPAINYGAPRLKSKSCGSVHGAIQSGEPQCACAKCPSLNNNVPAITIGAEPCWHRSDIANPCDNTVLLGLPNATASDFNGGSKLSTKGYQLILLSGFNFGTKGTSTTPAELESVTFGPYLGTEISMPILSDGSATLSKSEAGCKIHEATFSIVCNTKPGIAGPHSWIVTVKGQPSQETVQTNYERPSIVSLSPAQFPTSGGTTVVITGTEFGTADSAASFKVIFTNGAPVSDCNNTIGTHCFAIHGTKMGSLANGQERVGFPTPSGYGPNWSLRLIVTNSLTAQSVYTDVPSSLNVGYQNPSIDGVTIVNTGSTFTLTIVGSNFCDRPSENCANLFLCGDGENSTACDSGSTTINQITDARIESWSHTKIVARVGVSVDWIFVKPSGTSIASAKSNNAFFSTLAYSIQAGGDFLLNNAGTDLERTAKIPTAGQISPKLIIHVINLDSNNNIFVSVNNNKISIDALDCVLKTAVGVSPKLWEIKFSAPPGSGSKQTIKVSLGTKSTQNSAYIYYAKPIITDILMPTESSTVCTQKSAECPSIETTPGILPTEGKTVTIIGSNFGTRDDTNFFLFRWQSGVNAGNFASNLYYRDSNGVVDGQCTDHTHTSIKCTLPPSQGQGYTLFVEVAGQTPTEGAFPGSGRSISYAPPTISSTTATPPGLVPNNGPTLNPGTITVNGLNLGLVQPTMNIGGQACVVDLQTGGYHTSFKCVVQDGEGANLAAVATVGKQTSTGGAMFSYNAPTVSSFTPTSGPTSGMDADDKAINMTVFGTNFGTVSNTDIEIILQTLTEKVTRRFVANASTFISRSHTKIVFPLPEGYGTSVDVLVQVRGQKSSAIASKFSYIAPSVSSIAPQCGQYDCYGFKNPGFKNVEDYPKIISITTKANDVSTVQLSLVKAFPLELGMQVIFQGLSLAKGLSTGKSFNFDGTWYITKITSSTSFDVSSKEQKSWKGVPTIDTYLGWNNPVGNLRALASKTYSAGSAVGFNMLETDGCQSRDIEGIRDTGWEPYQFYAARIAQTDGGGFAGLRRECAFGKENNTQTIQIKGDNFGSALGLNTPISVTMTQKTCDCSVELDAAIKPCMATGLSRVCFAKDTTTGECPVDTTNCDTDTAYSKPRQLEIKTHTHQMIEVYSMPGFGRHHKIDIAIGNGRAAVPNNPKDAVMRYMPPTVTDFETPAAQTGGSTIYRPDGSSRITVLGYNFGSSNVTDSIEIRIGVDYDTDGTYCGDQEKCMKVCSSAQWHPHKDGGDASTRGFPYIDCVIPQDTAGFKNISVRIAGQTDNCRTNRKLCGYPLAYPADRRSTPINEFTNITLLQEQIDNDPNGGLIFTCARQSEVSQSYAKPGELCQDISNEVDKEECEDAACSKPKAKPGFWRLDLDLQFACNEGNNRSPCQTDLTDKYTGTSMLDALSSPFENMIGSGDSSDDDQLCYTGIQEGSNETVCAAGQRKCNERGGAAPGNCIFRRPKEARRAMGKEYWPFACPGTDLGDVYNKEDMSAAKAKCKAANPDAFQFVENLAMAGCPAGRTNHLVDYSVYDKFPALNMSTNCYSVVACNPKASCLGGNACGLGYEYQKHRCEAWNQNNPNKTSCSSDYDCRTRSGSTIGDAGLSSACAEGKEEDCSRCVIASDPETGISKGTCECTGGKWCAWFFLFLIQYSKF